jgi:hypothetical protein
VERLSSDTLPKPVTLSVTSHRAESVHREIRLQVTAIFAASNTLHALEWDGLETFSSAS